MAQRNPVPVFGEWESDVPYTAYFERARKANPSSSNNKQIAFPVNASCINASTSTCPAGDPTTVLRRHKEVSNAKEGQYPARKELKTRAEVCIARRMTNKPFHPRQEIVLHQGVSRVGAGYGIRSSFVRPWVGGGPRIRLSLEGNNSSESAGVTGSMPFPEKERFHRRPLAEVERVPIRGAGIPKFGEWNVNNASADYGFTQAFGQLRDQKKTGTSSVVATEAPPTLPGSRENFNANRRPKGNEASRSVCGLQQLHCKGPSCRMIQRRLDCKQPLIENA